jgi:oxygen-independent coproporphyrinogen-3 oxidase
LRNRYVRALCAEAVQRRDELHVGAPRTLYFGGGTPSLLTAADFDTLFDTLERTYGIGSLEEITLEANPDDLSSEYLRTLAALPFNRLSIGIQTFSDPILRRLNRRHTAAQATAAYRRARDAGFANISIDLMYGLPGQTLELLDRDIDAALALRPEHISAYHLTYEEGTPLYRMYEQGALLPADEDDSVAFYRRLSDTLRQHGYQHYEISNFSLPHFSSMHNSAYWEGTPYLGLGASAHSYDGTTRRWNVSDIRRYIKGIEGGAPDADYETLDLRTRYNEYILTALRTARGARLSHIRATFGNDYATNCLRSATPYLLSGTLTQPNADTLALSDEGMLMADAVMRALIVA